MVHDVKASTGRKIILSTCKNTAMEEADESAPVHKEVNKHKKPIDEDVTKNFSLLVGIGQILILLKCIVGLVCLVLFGIVYNISRL